MSNIVKRRKKYNYVDIVVSINDFKFSFCVKYVSYIDFFDYSDGLAIVEICGKYGYINMSGQIVIPCKYFEAKEFVNGYVLVEKDNEWIYIDKNGKIIE